MHKIYSRPRIRLPKLIFQIGNKKPNKNMEKSAKILLILLIAIITAKSIIAAISPIFDTLCEDKAKSIATIISNEQATNVMKEHSYEEIFSIEKDENGNITMIKSNIIPINEIISDVANKIQEEIDKRGRENIEIALRKFYRF
jgi:N-dimethylarginine dimethylaminohydrolase